jgi:hypothetical protein
LIAVVFMHLGCQKKSSPGKSIIFNGLNEKKIVIKKEKLFPGIPVGAEFNSSEIYVKDDLKKKGRFSIRVIDPERIDVKKEIELTAGDFNSPTEFFSPVQVQLIDDRYYVFDQFEKIVVFDHQFNHIHSSMFHQVRFFIDLFKKDSQICFVIATQQTSRILSSQVKVYELPTINKPKEKKSISDDFELQSIFSFMKGSSNDYYKGYFWPAVSGFEKDGTIYYSVGNSNSIYVYRLGTGKEEVYFFPFLRPKKYEDAEAEKLGFHKSDGWEERYRKKYGGKIVYKAYDGNIYHFGIHDVGVDKIGVAGSLNLERMTYRLDIINTREWSYIESIWLPMGYSFKRSIATMYRGLIRSYLDVDRGIYVYSDIVGEDFEYMVRILRFKVK